MDNNLKNNSPKQKIIFGAKKEQNTPVYIRQNDNTQPYQKSIIKGLDENQIQKDAMLLIRGAVIKELRSNDRGWEKRFFKAINREINFKKGVYGIGIVRDCIISS
jgi:hypothetical protein